MSHKEVPFYLYLFVTPPHYPTSAAREGILRACRKGNETREIPSERSEQRQIRKGEEKPYISEEAYHIVIKPLADGGEGTTEALVEGLGGHFVELTITGPLGEPVKARYGILESGEKGRTGGVAVLEMAQAAGITLIPHDALNPWKATTIGVGEMILDAIQRGCREFIMGIGGSATTEGGIGMLQGVCSREKQGTGILS